MRRADRSRVGTLAVTLILVASVVVVAIGAGSPATAASTFVVNTTVDTNDAVPGDGICADATGKCSLRAAAEESNELAGLDRVDIPAGTYKIGWPVSFTDDVTVVGAGSVATIVDGASIPSGVMWVGNLPDGPVVDATLRGLGLTRGDTTTMGGGLTVVRSTLTLNDVAIYGNTGTGGGIYNLKSDLTLVDSNVNGNVSTGSGGGILCNGGTVVIERSTVSFNESVQSGGGIACADITITDSTISDNTVASDTDETRGGGISSDIGFLTLTNSTVSGNSADIGGGIYSNNTLTVMHSTIARNTVDAMGPGAGIYNAGGSMTLTASILDENGEPATSSDCYSTVAPTSGGYNFIGDGTGCQWVAGTGDVVGPTGGGSLVGLAGLGPLQDNGGPTDTHALSPGPPPYTVNTIPAAACSVAADQRGVARPQGEACDNGAFEMTAPVAVDDDYATPVDTSLDVAASGVLGNDVEGDGGSLSVLLTRFTSGPQPTDHGVVTLWTDGSFDYTPDAGFEGVDSFTYTVRDRTYYTGQTTPANTDSATVTITVGSPQPDTVGLVDPTTGVWYLRNTAGAVSQFYYGDPGDYPFVGDWNCDGVETPGLYRQSDGFAYLRDSNSQGVADLTFFFGDPGDVPLAGDFNGDGCDTLSIYRPSEARFYIINELGKDGGGLGAADYSFLFGDTGDKPVVGDWDGDGVDEIGLHRESTGFFYYRDTLTTGVAGGQFYFGDPGDRFVAGDWGVVDGVDTPAIYRPSDSAFYFRHTLTQGPADSQFTWTGAGTDWLPVAGGFGLD